MQYVFAVRIVILKSEVDWACDIVSSHVIRLLVGIILNDGNLTSFFPPSMPWISLCGNFGISMSIFTSTGEIRLTKKFWDWSVWQSVKWFCFMGRSFPVSSCAKFVSFVVHATGWRPGDELNLWSRRTAWHSKPASVGLLRQPKDPSFLVNQDWSVVFSKPLSCILCVNRWFFYRFLSLLGNIDNSTQSLHYTQLEFLRGGSIGRKPQKTHGMHWSCLKNILFFACHPSPFHPLKFVTRQRVFWIDFSHL